MMERIRRLLEDYDGVGAPLTVQTDLSSARVPAYALSQRDQSVQGRDVRGMVQYVGTFVFQMRHIATGEQDRRNARAFLQALGWWVEGRCSAASTEPHEPQGNLLLAARAGLPGLQEAYDDGTAAWSMTLEIDWQCQQ